MIEVVVLTLPAPLALSRDCRKDIYRATNTLFGFHSLSNEQICKTDPIPQPDSSCSQCIISGTLGSRSSQTQGRPPMTTPEARARTEIDALLSAAGWRVQDRAQMNLRAGQGVAVREFALTSGFADYLLFV